MKSLPNLAYRYRYSKHTCMQGSLGTRTSTPDIKIQFSIQMYPDAPLVIFTAGFKLTPLTSSHIYACYKNKN